MKFNIENMTADNYWKLCSNYTPDKNENYSQLS